MQYIDLQMAIHLSLIFRCLEYLSFLYRSINLSALFRFFLFCHPSLLGNFVSITCNSLLPFCYFFLWKQTSFFPLFITVYSSSLFPCLLLGVNACDPVISTLKSWFFCYFCQAYNRKETIAVSSQVMNSQNYK